MYSTLLRVLLLLAVIVSCGQGLQSVRKGTQPSEYHVKAAFLLNFTKFIEWPEAQASHEGSNFSICVLGDDPFGNTLDSTVEGETVGGRKIVIRRIVPQAIRSCQVLFVSKSVTDLRHVLGNAGPGVLTVGEGDDFTREGGIIAFVLENRRVRFDINQAVAQQSGLTLSSRLLSVARSVTK